jgi:hypothetical protein
LKNSLKKRINAFCFTHDIDMAIQLSDEMIMTPKLVQDEPCNFISKGTFTYSKTNILFLIQIKGSDCVNCPPPEGRGD